MNLGRTFLLALAMGTGLAAPFFVFADGEGEALSAESRDRIDRAIEQLRSDSPVVRQAGEAALANESKDSLKTLRELSAKAKANGELDLERRLNDAISSIETREGPKPATPQPKSEDEARDGSTFRVELKGIPGATKTSTWIENGKVTSVSQSGDGKITLAIKGGTEPEVNETFENQAAFEAKYPEIAKRFAGMNSGFRFQMPSPFRGPWDPPAPSGEQQEPSELDPMDPIKQVDEMLERMGLGRGGLFPRMGEQPSLDGVHRALESLKTKQSELRNALRDPVEAEKKMAELEAETRKLEDEISKLRKPTQALPGQSETPIDPMERMRKMMEEMWRIPRGDGEPDEEAPGAPEFEDLFENFRRQFERRQGGGNKDPGERRPGAEKEPWKGAEPTPPAPENAPLPEKPKGSSDDN